MEEPKVSVEFTCECGSAKGWISEGQTSKPCPVCGAIYLGVYDKENLTIRGEQSFDVDTKTAKLSDFDKQRNEYLNICKEKENKDTKETIDEIMKEINEELISGNGDTENIEILLFNTKQSNIDKIEVFLKRAYEKEGWRVFFDFGDFGIRYVRVMNRDLALKLENKRKKYALVSSLIAIILVSLLVWAIFFSK